MPTMLTSKMPISIQSSYVTKHPIEMVPPICLKTKEMTCQMTQMHLQLNKIRQIKVLTQ